MSVSYSWSLLVHAYQQLYHVLAYQLYWQDVAEQTLDKIPAKMGLQIMTVAVIMSSLAT